MLGPADARVGLPGPSVRLPGSTSWDGVEREPVLAPRGEGPLQEFQAVTLLDRIRIRGFRRLLDVDLALRPLNVVIGVNGCGKTSLLDVFSLLADSASGRLQEQGHRTSSCTSGKDLRHELVVPSGRTAL